MQQRLAAGVGAGRGSFSL